MYDLHGSDYARVQQQHEAQQQQQRQQEQFFSAFGGHHHRRRQSTPIFSSTMWIGSDAYRELVEDSSESWLLQFYHDWSDGCKEFAPRWEALASKLQPMVRLGRVHIDQNFGIVQRYRSFVRCRQNAFFMECTAPAIVLVTPREDGETVAEAFRGPHPPSAEQVYEWVKRSLPASRVSVPSIKRGQQTAAGLAAFLAPPWAKGDASARRVHSQREAGRGRMLARGVIFSARPIADSLFARHMVRAPAARAAATPDRQRPSAPRQGRTRAQKAL